MSREEGEGGQGGRLEESCIRRETPRELVPSGLESWFETRGMSPVVGTLLVVVITLLIASALTASLIAYGGGLDEHKEGFDRAVGNESPWIGNPSGLVQLSNNEAGATDVRYRINFEYDPNDDQSVPLQQVNLEVTTGAPDMFSNTSEAELEYVSVDTDGDGEPNEYITSSVNGWGTSGGGTKMKIDFDGGYTLEPGDAIVAVFGGVDNPTSPGTYELEVETNGSGDTERGNVTIT